MRVQTKVKAGKLTANHNETLRERSMRVKTKVKAGRLSANHNTTMR